MRGITTIRNTVKKVFRSSSDSVGTEESYRDVKCKSSFYDIVSIHPAGHSTNRFFKKSVIKKVLFLLSAIFLISCSGSFQDKMVEEDNGARELAISILSPAEDINTSQPSIEVKGLVQDKANEIQKVEWQLNNGAWQNVERSGENWSASVDFVKGKNTLCARLTTNVGGIKEACRDFYRTLKPLTDFPFPRFQSGSCLEYKQKVYCIGGEGHEEWLSIYDLSTGRWSSSKIIAEYTIDIPFGGGTITEAQKESRKYSAVARIGDKIYVLGGLDKNDVYPISNLEYDTVNNRWKAIELYVGAEAGRVAGRAVSIGNKIYLFGGGNAIPGVSVDFFSSVQIFDPSKGFFDKWSTAPSLNTPRAGLVAVSDGAKIYAIGGYNSQDKMLSSVEVLDTSAPNPKWEYLPPMESKRFLASGGLINGRYLYVLGGFNFKRYETAIERYDLQLGHWETVGNLDFMVAENAFFTLENKIMLWGGMDGTGTVVRGGWEYEPYLD